MNPQTRIRQMMQAMNEQKAMEIKQGNDEFKAILNSKPENALKRNFT